MKTVIAPPHYMLLPAVLSTLLATWPQASGVVIRLVDVAEQAGITLLNICGGPSKDYIVDANGNGAALFDYDNDGDLDALDRQRLDAARNIDTGRRPMVALYPERRQGTLHRRDAARADSAHAAGEWATCVADYDNDGFQDVYVTAFGPNVLCPQQRRRHVHRRHARAPVSEIHAGARAARSAITTATATSICTWPTTWRSTS